MRKSEKGQREKGRKKRVGMKTASQWKKWGGAKARNRGG